ncbi:MAG: ABC transporter ATP-binding protein [Planctomycetes bacterium]|nr:ABC transporter ATP-binding protein [Planctomycetota bacterium]
MDVAVSVRSLSKFFGRFAALDDASFDVPQGSLFGVLGPNGAGKTTLFSILAGFLRASRGHVEVLGIDTRNVSALRGHFSILPQDAAFQAGIQVIDQLVMMGRLSGMDRAEAERRATEELERVGLGDVLHLDSRSLSHGMAKRAALAQAFLRRPEVIILDEPTAGLDPENARNVRTLVREMQGNRTVLISSHNLQEIQDLCDHVVILHKGKVRHQASMDAITGADSLTRLQLFERPAAELLARLGQVAGVTRIETDGEDGGRSINLHLMLSEGRGRREILGEVLDQLLRAGMPPRTMREGASLEARFLELTGGSFDGASST